MRKQLLSIVTFCAASLVLGAQAQSSSSDPSSTSPSSTHSSYGQSASRSGWSGSHLMGHQELSTSQLTGAQVTGSSGQQIGTISDIIVNPASGRLDFAVISVNESGTAGSATSSTSSTSSSSSSSSLSSTKPTGSAGISSTTGGKQVAVPWMLLRTSSMAAAGQTTSTPAGQISFVFNGDASKLQSAPNFEATTDLSQPSWRQSVFSYFGLSGTGSATGGAESPGSSGTSSGSTGSGTSSSDTSSGSSTTPQSGSSNP